MGIVQMIEWRVMLRGGQRLDYSVQAQCSQTIKKLIWKAALLISTPLPYEIFLSTELASPDASDVNGLHCAHRIPWLCGQSS